MVFDTLFALDPKFQPHPQKVGDYSISPDKLLYKFARVRGADQVASLTGWMARDPLGQRLAAVERAAVERAAAARLETVHQSRPAA